TIPFRVFALSRFPFSPEAIAAEPTVAQSRTPRPPAGTERAPSPARPQRTMVQYDFQYPRRVRAVHVGCGGHSFRNILPSYRFAPIELLAVCDVDARRAETFAREFGAERWYTDYQALLEDERPEAVFLVTGYLPDGRPTYPELAVQALAAGAHVWMEKPPAATTNEIRELRAAAERAGRQVMVGL